MIEPKPVSMYPTANSLDEAMDKIKSELSLLDGNQVHALVMMYHNTLLKEVAMHYGSSLWENYGVEKQCSVGVGDGTGDLFVYGKYEAVKRVQAMILENEDFRREQLKAWKK